MPVSSPCVVLHLTEAPPALRGEIGGGGDASRGSPRPISHDEPYPVKLASLEAAGSILTGQPLLTKRMTAGTFANTAVSNQGADTPLTLSFCRWLR